MDTCSDDGFALTLLSLLRVRRGGLFWIGTQCSTWVWINRKTSGRSKENPLGNTTHRSVVEGNELNARVALLCAIAYATSVTWVIEQPASSLFYSTRDMGIVMARSGAQIVHTWLGGFGHPMKKPTTLVGTASWLQHLRRPHRFTGALVKHEAKQKPKKTGTAKKACLSQRHSAYAQTEVPAAGEACARAEVGIPPARRGAQKGRRRSFPCDIANLPDPFFTRDCETVPP